MHKLTKDQLNEGFFDYKKEVEHLSLSNAHSHGMKTGFELGQQGQGWTHDQPTIEGFYLMRGAGRDMPELGLIQRDRDFNELCLYFGDSFDYFNTLANLTRDIEWKFVEPPPEQLKAEDGQDA